MARRDPIEDHYEQSFAVVSTDNAKLDVHYAAPIGPLQSIVKVRGAVIACLKSIKTSHPQLPFECGVEDVYQADGHNCFVVHIEHKNGDPSKLKDIEMKELARLMRAAFVIKDETSVHIRNCCEGNRHKPQTGRVIDKPAPALPTSAPSPQTTATAQGPAPASAPPPATPASGSLKQHYFMTTPVPAQTHAPLRLKYILNGPFFLRGATPDPKINADHGVLKAAIEQTIRDYNVQYGTSFTTQVGYPSSTSTVNSEFDAEFTKPPNNTPLSLPELCDVTDALEHAGCLQQSEAHKFKNAAGATAVMAAPPPSLQIAGSTATSAGRGVGGAAPASQPANPAVPLPAIQSCTLQIGPHRFSKKQSLTVEYQFTGPHSAISPTHTAFKTAIEDAAKAVNVSGISRIEADVWGVTSTRTNSGSNGLMNSTFKVMFERKLHNARENMLEVDMRGLITALSNKGCIRQSDVSPFHQQVTAASSTLSRTP